MISKTSTVGMTRDQWVAARKQGIGGSDAATIVGLNPYSSRLYLYADKLDIVPEKEDSEAMRQGRDLEQYVADRWCESTGKKVHRENAILCNDLYPFAFANIDRKVAGENAILECKTTSVYNNSDFASGAYPNNYYVQVQHYLAVTGFDIAYLAVLVLNKGFYAFEIPRNQTDIDALMSSEKTFWEENVLKQVPPDADGSDSAMIVLNQTNRTEGVSVMPDMDAAFVQLQEVSEKIKAAQEEESALKQLIIQRLGEFNRGQSYTYSCTYLPQSKSTVDAKALRDKFPDAYAQTVKTSTFSVLRYKKNKE